MIILYVENGKGKERVEWMEEIEVIGREGACAGGRGKKLRN